MVVATLGGDFGQLAAVHGLVEDLALWAMVDEAHVHHAFKELVAVAGVSVPSVHLSQAEVCGGQRLTCDKAENNDG